MRKRKSAPKPRKSNRWKGVKADLTYLQAYEEAVILRDIASFGGGYVSAAELRLRFPMRYSPTRLPITLKRMTTRKQWTGHAPLTSRLNHKRRLSYKLAEVEAVKRQVA